MDAQLATPILRRHDGDDRRVSRAAYQGAERRVPDPSTEQDDAELYEPQAAEPQ